MKEQGPNMSSIGSVFLKARKNQGLTRAVLSEKTGLSIQTIGKIENGHKTNFKIETFVALLSALDLSADYVLGGLRSSDLLSEACQSLTNKQQEFILVMIKKLKEYDS